MGLEKYVVIRGREVNCYGRTLFFIMRPLISVKNILKTFKVSNNLTRLGLEFPSYIWLSLDTTNGFVEV